MADTKARPDKAAAVAALTENFRSASATVLTEYRGLSMDQLTTLRRSLGRQTSYTVTKNTLVKIAAHDAGLTELDALLTGPTAIAFVNGDPVEAAKGLRDFAKTNPHLVIKGGVLDGKLLSPAEIGKLADLESREVLLARLAGAFVAKLSQAAATFAAPATQMARLLAALQEKKAAEAPPAAEAPAEAGAVDTAVAEAGETTLAAPGETADAGETTQVAAEASTDA